MYVLDPETTFKAVGLQPEQHSYCMGADQVSPFAPTCAPRLLRASVLNVVRPPQQGGLSSVVETFVIDDDKFTPSDLRKSRGGEFPGVRMGS
jgi:hypothetical protein